MAEVTVGTAKINLAMDASSMEVVMERVKRSQQGMSDQARAEADKMTVAQRRVVQSLERQAQKVGLTREEWIRYNIVTRTSGETQARLLKQLDDNTKVMERQGRVAEKTVNQVNQYGLTGKQQVAAMRQVPAQLTDIFVSLQGGQRPMTVLIQQGGQLKDVFGGVVPAVKALSTQLLAMVNPASVAAGATAALGVAWYQGEAESRKFNQAIINSGNFAQTSAAQLQGYAEQLDGIDGVTQRAAAGALTTMVSTGRIAQEQLLGVTEAALRLERNGGASIQETAQAFADIGRDPVSAIIKLNESMNFLDRSTLDHIMTLQEQGRMQEAAAAATEAYANAVISRSKEVTENLGWLETAWRSIKSVAAEAWDAMLGVGRQDDLAKQVLDARDALAKIDPNSKAAGNIHRRQVLESFIRENQFATVQGEALGSMSYTDTQEYKKAFEGWQSAAKAARDDAAKLADELREIERQGKVLGKSAEEIAALQNAARANAARKGSRGDGGMANAVGKAELQAIKDAESVQRAEIANTGKILQAEYAARLVNEQQYFDQRRQLAERDFQVQERSLLQQIEVLRNRSASGKDAVNVSRELGVAEAELAKVRADHATQQVILGIQEDALTAKRQRALEGYRESLMLANEAARSSVEASLLRITMGEREADYQQKLADIEADVANKRRQLAREFADNNDQALYDQKLRELENYMDEQVRILRDGYDRMREAEADWRNGLRAGWENWRAGAQDVAGQIEKITVSALNGATDALTEFATTSKLTWRDLLLDLGEQIVRFMMQQAVLEFASAFLGMWGSGGGGGGSTTTSKGFDGFKKNALGDTYSGSPSLSRYSGTVVNQPTPFYFARGAGVMGEAGPEGIFPLERGSDGKLGVKAMGAGGAGPVTVITNVNVHSDGSTDSNTQTAGEQANMYREFAQMIENGARQQIQRAMMPGGLLWKARVN